jgi:hypothetical protein
LCNDLVRCVSIVIDIISRTGTMPPHPIDAYTWLTAAHQALVANGLLLSLQSHNDPHLTRQLALDGHQSDQYPRTRNQIIDTILQALGPSQNMIRLRLRNTQSSLPILDLIHEIRVMLDEECTKSNVSLVSDMIPDDAGKVGYCTLRRSTIRKRRKAGEGGLRCMKGQCLVLVHLDCVA